VITAHSTDAKAISLGVEAGLKLSFAGGLISVDGAAHTIYLQRHVLLFSGQIYLHMLCYPQSGDSLLLP
jgi:hypothetical protein